MTRFVSLATRETFIPTGSVKVTAKGCDACAYIYTNGRGRPAAVMFAGKSAKPVSMFYYMSEESREKAVRSFFAGQLSRASAKAERRAERSRAHTLEVGHVLVSQYGYEQTNTDFWAVVGIVGKNTVEVRKCGALVTKNEGDRGYMIPNVDAVSGETLRRRADARGYVKIDDVRRAHLWEGRPVYWSSYH